MVSFYVNSGVVSFWFFFFLLFFFSGRPGAEGGDGSHSAAEPEPGLFYKFVWVDGKEYK